MQIHIIYISIICIYFISICIVALHLICYLKWGKQSVQEPPTTLFLQEKCESLVNFAEMYDVYMMKDDIDYSTFKTPFDSSVSLTSSSWES